LLGAQPHLSFSNSAKRRAPAHFCHNLTMLEFDSSRHGMGDDAGSGKLGTGTVCAGRGMRLPLFFLG
jgi:hypothetical protein